MLTCGHVIVPRVQKAILCECDGAQSHLGISACMQVYRGVECGPSQTPCVYMWCSLLDHARCGSRAICTKLAACHPVQIALCRCKAEMLCVQSRSCHVGPELQQLEFELRLQLCLQEILLVVLAGHVVHDLQSHEAHCETHEITELAFTKLHNIVQMYNATAG